MVLQVVPEGFTDVLRKIKKRVWGCSNIYNGKWNG